MVERRVVKAKPPPTMTMLSFHFLQGIPVPERPPDSHDFPFLHIVEKGGHQPDFIDRELDESLFRGRGSDPDGDFPFAGDGQFGKLAGVIGETRFILRVQKDELKGFQVPIFGLGNNLIDPDRVG